MWWFLFRFWNVVKIFLNHMVQKFKNENGLTPKECSVTVFKFQKVEELCRKNLVYL
jgi:hypothetical protein